MLLSARGALRALAVQRIRVRPSVPLLLASVHSKSESAGQSRAPRSNRPAGADRPHREGNSGVRQDGARNQQSRNGGNRGGNSGRPGNSGHGGNARHGNAGHSGNSRPGNGGHSGNSRPGNGGHSGNSRPGNGGQSGNSRPGNGGQSGNNRPGNGGHSGNSRPGHSRSGHDSHSSKGNRRAVPSAKRWDRPAPKSASASSERKSAPKPKKAPKVQPKVYLPDMITVFHLARVLKVNMRMVQFRMEKIGITDVRPDRLLKFEDAALVAAEYNVDAVADNNEAFDIFPRPPVDAEAHAALPLRPPVVTIMGHVDHGKTTLLDRLRSSSVAQGEAGGITQHIGAFSVPVAGARKDGNHVDTITFLDTPGHAAFSMMRSRGASVTDIVVLVVAADDSVKPQTMEVIDLVRREDAKVPLLVAISKVDKPGANVQKVRNDLLVAGIEVEDIGGDVPVVELSAKTGQGIDELEETLAAMAEMAELRAEKVGAAEGRVLESRVDKGRGNVATVIVTRGELKTGDYLVCGTSWARVRQLMTPDGRAAKTVYPGSAALVAGWRDLPSAGDEFLGAPDEAKAKHAVDNRMRARENEAQLADAEQIDANRRARAEEEAAREQREFDERRRQREIARLSAEGGLSEEEIAELVGSEEKPAEEVPQRPELHLILKGDFSGTVEALAGALSGLDTPKAGVRIVSQGVGDPTESDVNTAHAVGGHIVGFNVRVPKSVQTLAAGLQPKVGLHCDNVIYRLMEHVTGLLVGLLPPIQETRVVGEASVAQLFQIKTGSKGMRNIAGCRVTNGVINRTNEVRILRGNEREQVFRGRLDALRQVKKDVTEMRKGTECGMSFDGFDDVRVGDVIQCVVSVDVPQSL
ncbi:translation initiation factor IF-2 [Malassezia cuniculi]|uniref:Translation initiation factor IF-2, mitochondrial n=1 Tax=Malassezia cuniculi TaxID=948313 RepID=A0AAF0EZM2_9BASI|nr:translation initiation factor IF-2 [Malassezia cuniculi]